MFENKKLVLFIAKSKIIVSEVTIANNPTEKIIGKFDWTPPNLDDILLKIKRIIRNSNIRMLLSEDFVYVVHITLPAGINLNKDIVRQKAQGLIPEDLNETVWDFKEIIKPSPSLLNLKSSIQVVAVVKMLFEQLSKSLTKVGFHAETIEPLSYALARFTKQQEHPFLFVYVTDEILLTLAQKEIVFATQRLNYINQTYINQFLAFAKEKFSIEIKNIIFCGNSKSIDVKQFSNANVKAEIQNINPAISLALKEDIKGKDEDVLNLSLLKILSFDNQAQPINNNISSIKTKSKLANKTPPQQNHFPYTIILALGIVIAIGIGGLITYKNIASKNSDISKENKFTPAPTTLTFSPTPSVEQSSEIDKSTYTISILNGSGIAGRATKLEDLLKDNGFNVVKTGNAETFDYENTEVLFKENVSPEFILPLDKLLKTLYDFSIGIILEEEYHSDILIIVGKGIKK